MKFKFRKIQSIICLLLISIISISNNFSISANGNPDTVCDLIYDCTLNSDVFDGRLIYTYTDSESYNADFTITGGSYDGQHWTWTVDLESRMIYDSNSIYSDYTHDPYIAPKYYLRIGGSLIISMGDHDRVFDVIGQELVNIPNIGNIETWKCYNSPTNSYIWYSIETYFTIKSDMNMVFDGTNYHLTSILKSAGSLSFLDDDYEPPSIQTTLPTSINPTGIVTRTDGNPGTFSWSVSDQSPFFDLSVYVNSKLIAFLKESGSYVIPNSLGTHTFYIYAEDNDNDRYNDRLSSEKYDYINIIDDDTSIPQININYQGDSTDGMPGFWTVSVSDLESGIKEINVFIDGIIVGHSQGIYNVSNSLGEHIIQVEAWNNDLDRGEIDQEYNSDSSIISIIDDDTTEPEISIDYFGSGCDGNSGYFSWIITDTDDGIGGDGDTGFSEIDIRVTYDSTEGLPDEEFILEPNETGIWYLPPYLGIYTITIFAIDNDDDRTLIVDSLSTELIRSQDIIDDDISPPEISNLIITDDIHEVYVDFQAIDDSSGDDQGIGEIYIFIDNELIITYFPSPSETIFCFNLPNDWIMNIGSHQVRIEIWDADDDRLGDSLSDEINGTFEIILDEMKQYVCWEIDQLNEKIQGTLDDCWKNPASNRKMASNNKLNALKDLIFSYAFEDAYDKLLHDIKPKLTGLKTDENEEPWGNGVFENPWVICSDLNEEFRLDCNKILTHIKILIINA